MTTSPEQRGDAGRVTDEMRVSAIRSIYDHARTASSNNLALAIGSTIGALAMLLNETADGPSGSKVDLLEMAIEKLIELTTPHPGARGESR